MSDNFSVLVEGAEAPPENARDEPGAHAVNKRI